MTEFTHFNEKEELRKEDNKDFLLLHETVDQAAKAEIIKRIRDRTTTENEIKRDKREQKILDFEFKPVETTLHEVMQHMEADKNIKDQFTVIAERDFYNANYATPNGNYKWEKLARSSNNDTVSENACVSFIDNDNNIPNWFDSIPKLAKLGELLHYEKQHYENAITRIVAYFEQTKLDLIFDHMTLNEKAQHLMGLTIAPDPRTELNIQLTTLTRPANTPLNLIMTRCHGISKALYHNEKIPEVAARRINDFLINCLLVFTNNQVHKTLLGIIERKKFINTPLTYAKLKLNCESAESSIGRPTVDLHYHTNHLSNTKLFTIHTHIKPTHPGTPIPGTTKKLMKPSLDHHMTEPKPRKPRFMAPHLRNTRQPIPPYQPPQIPNQPQQQIDMPLDLNISNQDYDYHVQEQERLRALDAISDRVQGEHEQQRAYNQAQQNINQNSPTNTDDNDIFFETSHSPDDDHMNALENTDIHSPSGPTRNSDITTHENTHTRHNSITDPAINKISTRSQTSMANHKWDGTKYVPQTQNESLMNMQYNKPNYPPQHNNRNYNNYNNYNNNNQPYRTRSYDKNNPNQNRPSSYRYDPRSSHQRQQSNRSRPGSDYLYTSRPRTPTPNRTRNSSYSPSNHYRPPYQSYDRNRSRSPYTPFVRNRSQSPRPYYQNYNRSRPNYRQRPYSPSNNYQSPNRRYDNNQRSYNRSRDRQQQYTRPRSLSREPNDNKQFQYNRPSRERNNTWRSATTSKQTDYTNNDSNRYRSPNNRSDRSPANWSPQSRRTSSNSRPNSRNGSQPTREQLNNFRNSSRSPHRTEATSRGYSPKPMIEYNQLTQITNALKEMQLGQTNNRFTDVTNLEKPIEDPKTGTNETQEEDDFEFL